MPSRAAARAALAGIVLGVPTVLAFFAGGYFAEPTLWAGIVIWAVVLAALALDPRALPRRRESWLALGGLAGLAGWSLISIAWAPVADDALAGGQRVLLYTGLLAAATLLCRERRIARAVEPALAAGALIVIGYGISERLLPGLLHFHRSESAEGRLEQPLTYWNAMGELAALGLILVARLAGDRTRAVWLRTLAAPAAALFGLALYLSVSRGALFAAAAGLLTLAFAAPSRATLRAIAVAIAAAVLASIAAAPFTGVTSLQGAVSHREKQGAVVLVLLVVIAVAAALAQRWVDRYDDAPVRLPRHAPWAAFAIVCLGLAVAIVSGAHEKAGARLGGGAARFGSLQSDRYDYWRVALKAFGHQPLHGVGAENWSVYWLRWRPVGVGATDTHSLPLQTLAELGLVGAVLLLCLVAGIVLALRRAHRRDLTLTAGLLAALVGYLAHSPLDWDWQMPAVTGVALVLAGSALAQGERVEPVAGSLIVPRLRFARGAPVLVGALAVLALAWSVLSVRQNLLENQVDHLLETHSHLTATQLASADRTLDDAAWLNPTWELRSLRATVAGHAGQYSRVLAIARAGVRFEPDNVQTWLLLGLTVGPRSPVYPDVAANLHRLIPPVAPPH